MGLLIRGGVVAQHDVPGSVVEATQMGQAGEQSGVLEQASGEAGGKAEVVTKPQPIQQPVLAPIVEHPRHLLGWVDYEARLVDPKYF